MCVMHYIYYVPVCYYTLIITSLALGATLNHILLTSLDQVVLLLITYISGVVH